MILVKHMARVDLPQVHRLEVLSAYGHEARNGDFIQNYKYANGVAYLPLNPRKLKWVARLLKEQVTDQRSPGAPLTTPFVANPSFTLRDHQLKPAPALLSEVQKNKYAVIQAGCGLGKTVVMAWVSGRLNCKILILVDMGALQTQWQDAFQMVWERGVQVIRSDTTVFSDVCVATFQLLNANPSLVKLISKEFGCLLLDEFHTTQSDTRREILFRLDNQYRIGCTATPYKKNYSDEVLSDLVADVSIQMEDANALKAEVSFIPTGAKFYTNNPDDWGKIQSKLAQDPQRNLLIAREVLRLIGEGRRVLLIGITVASLQEIARHLSLDPSCRATVYTGSTTLKQDRALRDDLEAGRVNCILTVKKTDKGLDLPALDALVLARPANNKAFVTQISGRIVRPVAGKPTPVILDLIDVCPLGKVFALNRQKFYRELGYIISIDISNALEI